MSSEKIYDSIFDAFRVIAPNSPLLDLEKGKPHFFHRTNEYNLIDMGTYIGAYAGNPFGRLFRGEYKEYPNSKASIYRGNSDEIIIDKIRIIEFKNILQTFPQIQYAIKDHANVDYLALAQHYELHTWMIDLTSEPEIAAYFATHEWIKGVPTPVETGIGRIRGINIILPNSKIHYIGLQCFKRPGLQAAYGIEMDEDEDLGNRGWTVRFKQNATASRIIHQNFHFDYKEFEKHKSLIDISKHPELFTQNSWLMPDEEIAEVADKVKNGKELSQAAIEEYTNLLNPKEKDEVFAALSRNDIKITEQPVYVLGQDRIIELEKEYKNKPYGDVQLHARLTCKPNAIRN